MKKKAVLLLVSLVICACGDFPDYEYEQSQQYCVLKFPFVGGYFNVKQVGYFNIVSSLQYLDKDPQLFIFIGGPSEIDYEIGSVQKVEINNQFFKPEFRSSLLLAEIQYFGAGFVFSQQQSQAIYQALQQGYDLTIHGRLEVGKLYQADIYNFFFADDDKPFKDCIVGLLDEEDIKILNQEKS